MYERRLTIFMIVIFFVGLVLISRLFAVQVVQRARWEKEAVNSLTKPQITETTRGRILDIHGKPLAMDIACIDACVDYRAIIEPPDPKWVAETATNRLKARLGNDYRATKGEKRKALLADETAQVLGNIKVMWVMLAQRNPAIAGEPNTDAIAAMDEIRKGIVQSVQLRRQWVNSRNQQRERVRSDSSWFKFLAGASDSGSADTLALLTDETEAHVVLPALDDDTRNFFGKRLEQFPGLSLRASTHRNYPQATVACHLLGRMSRVSAGDLAQSRQEKPGELREYQPNDLIGRDGVEALCEPLLRGTRGKIETRVSDRAVITQQDFVPGADVHLSIDSDLQKHAQDLLQHVVERVLDEQTGQRVLVTPEEGVSMHAAIVVLDVKTNEVRVLASNPGFDVNDLETHYGQLIGDEYNQPLINRATSDAFEPGSTVKPLIGLGAITDGKLGATEPVNCGGYLYLPEMDPHGVIHMVRIPGSARCWILSENKAVLEEMKRTGNKTVPPTAMHGPLDYAGALERSCDVFFETAADRLTPTGVSHWMEQFGLGRPTGIGIFERAGLRPDLFKNPAAPIRADNCLAGMGQGKVLATPLQIANEAATIARGGIWMRPRLLSAETQTALDAIHPKSDAIEAIDLHLNPEALQQAGIGMTNVVDGPAGTGKIQHDGYTVAAKTGTADASPLSIKGQRLTPVYRNGEETSTPWYRSEVTSGFGVVHSWYMGYAPAENPRVAFCVLVEYAGAGGSVAAAPIASEMLEACASAGYLHTKALP